ncbi:MAG: deoxynucleoside kinase [Candidatus Pacebacteria bacterium]|nr:deoxynucleoside kinase [Candidatus Paceibacterota bacterium]
METKNKRGKFIVIDGTDGSGKGTQTELLVAALKDQGVKVVVTDFPQYGKPSAIFVEKYLRGEYGSADEVGAKRASLFYALDRFDESKQMKQWLDEGFCIVSNRYVSANMGHQTGKIKDPVERDKFLDWLNELEFEIFEIPKPDEVIFLYVPPEVGQKLVDEKSAREYTKGAKRDIHEADLNHLKNASEAYKYVAEKFNWKTVICAPNGEMMSREEIHKIILEISKKIIEIN